MEKIVSLIEYMIDLKIAIKHAAGHEHWYYEKKERLAKLREELKHALIVWKES